MMKNITLFQKWLVSSLFFATTFLPSTQAQWSVIDIPNPHVQFTAVAYRGKVYLGPAAYFGGFDTKVDIYNLEFSGWEETTDVSAPRSNAASVAANGSVYFAGGLANSWLDPVMLDVVDILDVETGEWTTEQLSEARSELKAVRAGERLLFAGGISNLTGDFSGTPTDITTSAVVDIYNLTTGQWSIGSLSEARVGLAAAVWGDIAIIAGGQTKTGEVTKAIDIYDAATDTWSTMELSEAKGWCEAAAMDGKIYIAGGATGDGQSTDKVEILDVETMTWTYAQLSIPRGGIRSGVMGTRVFFAGGGNYDLTQYFWTSFLPTVDIYDWETGEWTVENLQAPRINHAAVVAENKFFVAGGAPSSLNKVEIFTDESFTLAKEQLLEMQVSISPNPVTDAATLLVEASTDEVFQVEILDLNGRLMKSLELKSGTSMPLDMKDWSSGTYFVKVFNEKGMVTKKVVRQ